MNNIEADICLKRALPVRIIMQTNEYQKAKHYMITELHKCREGWVSKDFIMTAGLSPENNQRTSFTEKIDNIEVLPEFEKTLAVFYKNQRRKIIKALVTELLDSGENKTTLGKMLKDLIDDIRNKQS
ncbi:MAG: hypothetical protein IKO53_04905 [Lachnospiraceae bacterium]|nr:hypothetical protein [Lachnospiraceae bacterium]